ncbi:MAG TPA: hypothetical protein VHY77_04390 [Acidimicrobiales bacterium]|nr:hypothetical protein [Acidimicrobiales bacterium]
MPPDDPPDVAPEGAGTTPGAGAGAAGAGVGVDVAGGVDGVDGTGVDPEPELDVPPVGGAVTGAVGAGVGTGTGAGALGGGTKDWMGAGRERTGLEGNDPLLESETSCAVTAFGVPTVGDVTTAVERAEVADVPALNELGRAAAAALPLLQTELAGAGADEDGAVAGAWGAGRAGGALAGGTGAGVAISPDQSEAEYVLFEMVFMVFFWATGEADAARAVPRPTATTPTSAPWVTREARSRRAPTFWPRSARRRRRSARVVEAADRVVRTRATALITVCPSLTVPIRYPVTAGRHRPAPPPCVGVTQ